MSGVHELVTLFQRMGTPLNRTLTGMLEERDEHRTERRGSGFTQATRHLATQINVPRASKTFEDLSLFTYWRSKHETKWFNLLLEHAQCTTWRHWDVSPPALDPASAATEPDKLRRIEAERTRQAALRTLPNQVEREENRLLASLIRDIVLPVDARSHDLTEIPSWPDKLPVGSCPTAEKCFLELAHGFIPRKGRCNLLVNEQYTPIFVEKMNMGDNHSCVSLLPVILNGVRIPAGSLFAVHYDEDAIDAEPLCAPFPGLRIPIGACEGFRVLRLTTLAVSPQNRARAFSSHFEAQISAGLFEPKTTELEQLYFKATDGFG